MSLGKPEGLHSQQHASMTQKLYDVCTRDSPNKRPTVAKLTRYSSSNSVNKALNVFTLF